MKMALNFASDLSEALENYLEAIYFVVEEKQAAKPRDIARALDVNNSSVTGALRILAEKKLINYAPFEVITMTPEGRDIAECLACRHAIFQKFFMQTLAIEEAEADEVACKMEHIVTPNILRRFIAFLDHIQNGPVGQIQWVEGKGFERFDAEAE